MAKMLRIDWPDDENGHRVYNRFYCDSCADVQCVLEECRGRGTLGSIVSIIWPDWED